MTRGIFSITGCIALLAVMCWADVANAQPGRGRGRGGSWWGTSALQLLSNERVQDELEIVDEQKEIVEQLQQEQRDTMREMFSGMRERFREMGEDDRQSAMEEIREKMTESNKEFEERVFEELLPHQVDRLKQLILQASNRRGGGITGGRFSETLIEDLGITEEQIEKMKEKAEKVRVDLEKKMAKLRSQAEQEILSVLDASQREKYRELVGETFEFGEDEGRRGRGGLRRERGERGERGGRRDSPRGDRSSDSDF